MATLSGTTTLNGVAAQARVSVLDLATNQIVASQLSNAVSGAFSFTTLDPGDYEIVIFIDGYQPRADGPWTLT